LRDVVHYTLIAKFCAILAAPTQSHRTNGTQADSSSRNAVTFSSAWTTKRLPSPRAGSAIQIVRPSESTADTQPQAPSGFAEIVSDDFPVLHLLGCV